MNNNSISLPLSADLKNLKQIWISTLEKAQSDFLLSNADLINNVKTQYNSLDLPWDYVFGRNILLNAKDVDIISQKLNKFNFKENILSEKFLKGWLFFQIAERLNINPTNHERYEIYKAWSELEFPWTIMSIANILKSNIHIPTQLILFIDRDKGEIKNSIDCHAIDASYARSNLRQFIINVALYNKKLAACGIDCEDSYNDLGKWANEHNITISKSVYDLGLQPDTYSAPRS